MSETLDTVSDYIESARQLLQDNVQPFRYADQDVLVGFNMMLLEARRLRPDLFIKRFGNKVPHFDANDGETVHIEPQFRLGLVYGTAAYALSFDQEDVNDARATSYYQFFHSILVGQSGIQFPPLKGGTPGPGNPKG